MLIPTDKVPVNQILNCKEVRKDVVRPAVTLLFYVGMCFMKVSQSGSQGKNVETKGFSRAWCYKPIRNIYCPQPQDIAQLCTNRVRYLNTKGE